MTDIGRKKSWEPAGPGLQQLITAEETWKLVTIDWSKVDFAELEARILAAAPKGLGVERFIDITVHDEAELSDDEIRSMARKLLEGWKRQWPEIKAFYESPGRNWSAQLDCHRARGARSTPVSKERGPSSKGVE